MTARGKCARCGYSFPLKRDGTVQRHRLYVGSGRVWCDEAEFLDDPVEEQDGLISQGIQNAWLEEATSE